MRVATTCHESRIATTSRNVEVKRVQRVRFLGLLPAPLCANVVVRILFVHESFPISGRRFLSPLDFRASTNPKGRFLSYSYAGFCQNHRGRGLFLVLWNLPPPALVPFRCTNLILTPTDALDVNGEIHLRTSRKYIYPLHSSNKEAATCGRSALCVPRNRVGCRARRQLQILRVPRNSTCSWWC